MLHGSTVYYWTPSGLVYSWTSGSDSQELPLANAVDPSECVWPADDILIYTDTNGDVHEYSLTTGADVLRDELYTLPEKEKGFLSGNMLYYSYSTSAYWDNLVTGDSDGVSFSEFADAEPSETAAPVESRDPADFDISSGLKIDISGDKQILSNDYFSVALPGIPQLGCGGHRRQHHCLLLSSRTGRRVWRQFCDHPGLRLVRQYLCGFPPLDHGWYGPL